MLRRTLSLFALFVSIGSYAQIPRPKLLVGIVVDQMRYDYLYRFYSRFSEGGFKRMMNEGYLSHNTHYSYIPTYTGPGHASIFTGTTPAVHGIIANEWYSRTEQRMLYCAGDSSQNTVGSNSGAGEMSPHRMLAGTLGDALKLFTAGEAKVIGIGMKDRGAILSAGHSANGAYWFDGGKEGKWISSTWYVKELPEWVKEFNSNDGVKKMLDADWNTLFSLDTYVTLASDDNLYEGKFRGEEKPVFPHRIGKIAVFNRDYDILKAIPAGNTLTKDFAKAAVQGEKLGTDQVTDLLTLSFSATDYIGHQFGVNSVELEDAYLRLDRDLEDFFKFLDLELGKGNWTAFLTADHAGVEVPGLLRERKIPAGYFDEDSLKTSLESFIAREYGGHGIIENISNDQIFLNADSLEACQIGDEEIVDIIDYIQAFEGIDRVVVAGELEYISGDDVYGKLKKGYHPKFSGDIIYTLHPGWLYYSRTGSSHGSGYEYDTHVPLLFMGWGIKKGESYAPVLIEDIAPTVSSLLRIPWPNACTGKPIEPVLR